MSQQKKIISLVEKSVKEFSSKEAICQLVDGKSNSLTYFEMWEKVLLKSDFLKKLGIKPGDRIILCEASNNINWVINFLATSHAGATVLTLDPSLSSILFQNY